MRGSGILRPSEQPHALDNAIGHRELPGADVDLSDRDV